MHLRKRKKNARLKSCGKVCGGQRAKRVRQKKKSATQKKWALGGHQEVINNARGKARKEISEEEEKEEKKKGEKEKQPQIITAALERGRGVDIWAK